jgi:hypothetical protein
MDVIPAVIPGLTRDPATAAGWIPAFAGMTSHWPLFAIRN